MRDRLVTANIFFPTISSHTNNKVNRVIAVAAHDLSAHVYNFSGTILHVLGSTVAIETFLGIVLGSMQEAAAINVDWGAQ